MEALLIRNNSIMCPLILKIPTKLSKFGIDDAGKNIVYFAYNNNEMGTSIWS